MSVKMREGLQYITFVTATSLLTQSLLLTLFSMVYVMIQNVNFFFFFFAIILVRRITQAWVNILNSFFFFFFFFW